MITIAHSEHSSGELKIGRVGGDSFFFFLHFFL